MHNMGYNALDILNKAIDIENRKKIRIESLVAQGRVIPSVALITKVLCSQIDELIKYYEELKKIKNIEFEEIDIITYDKISFLINEFNNKIYTQDIESVKDYLNFSLSLAKDKYSLFMDIQGRLVKNINDVNTQTYDILSQIINTSRKQIEMIENTIS